jgi:hypothetical protein
MAGPDLVNLPALIDDAKSLLGNNLSRWSHAGMEVRLSAAATKRRDRSSSNLLRAQKRCLIPPRSATSPAYAEHS